LFGEMEATEYKVLDAETIEVITPAGSLGTVDVLVKLNGNGQQGVLRQAFTYQQSPQAQIRDKGRIYDLALDPTGSYLFAAQGSAGVLVYAINAGDQVANPDTLLGLVDRNRDGNDDRIVSRVT